MSDHTERSCPKCGVPGLIASDDPDQEGWGSTTEWTCPNCGYWSPSDFDLEQDEIFEDEYEGFDDDENEDC